MSIYLTMDHFLIPPNSLVHSKQKKYKKCRYDVDMLNIYKLNRYFGWIEERTNKPILIFLYPATLYLTNKKLYVGEEGWESWWST